MGKYTLCLILALTIAVPATTAQETVSPKNLPGPYQIDGNHSSIVFSIKHMGITLVYGRFNAYAGEIFFDPEDPGKNSISIEVETSSVDTGIAARDEHLRQKDFFDVETHPTMTFRSTSCKPLTENTFELTGDFTLMGITQEIRFPVTYNGSATYKGEDIRTGYDCAFTIRRSDFKLGPPAGPIADEVQVIIALQAIREEADQATE